MALPTLQVVRPSLRPGAVIIVDNIVGAVKGYADLIQYLDSNKKTFSRLTLPYSRGLEMLVYNGVDS
jgi:hypothetical protein